jgi:hypothetical protein
LQATGNYCLWKYLTMAENRLARRLSLLRLYLANEWTVPIVDDRLDAEEVV